MRRVPLQKSRMLCYFPKWPGKDALSMSSLSRRDDHEPGESQQGELKARWPLSHEAVVREDVAPSPARVIIAPAPEQVDSILILTCQYTLPHPSTNGSTSSLFAAGSPTSSSPYLSRHNLRITS